MRRLEELCQSPKFAGKITDIKIFIGDIQYSSWLDGIKEDESWIVGSCSTTSDKVDEIKTGLRVS